MFSNNNFNTHCSASYGSTAAVSGSTSERYNAGKEFSKDAANFVSSLFECPESKSIVSLGDFIHYALYRTRLHISVALSALILLQRLKARYPNAKGSSGHRLWLAAIMITNKMFNDDSFTNQSWYIASQQIFSQREVNAVERELFGYLSCDVRVTTQEIVKFTKVFNIWRKRSVEAEVLPSSPSILSSKLNRLNYGSSNTPALSPATSSTSSTPLQTPIQSPHSSQNNLISQATNNLHAKKSSNVL
ncbi:PHO85 cyclin-9 [Wallemia ichthyophaga EXF-994]|uniref:PHO85 cyclin-9 n=1 Tax=Wallemia ichthyophaga (strain EXF-994 / CBS 113033) TaxID=1299270 RepID=R9AGV5_WALI9|nr:PHO85 cyclin-9 [Wallemia ichthyophaga EXF-994]EOR01360.1 PHO85 cyclin-9 [Wallemia ichthyophaga EXF-994]